MSQPRAAAPRRRQADASATAHRRADDPETVLRLHQRIDDHDALIAEILKWKAAEVEARAANASEHARVMAALKILTEAVESNTTALGQLAGVSEAWQSVTGAGRMLDCFNRWLTRLAPLVVTSTAFALLWSLLTGGDML